MEHALPRTWSLCMTSENHGTVGPAGCKFSHAPEKHERVLVVEAPAGTRAPVAEFKGYVGGEPAVTWLDRDNMPRVGTKLFAGPAAAQAGQVAPAEELARFCPACGSVGDVGPAYRDCCPDGNEARRIPKRLAEKCHELFTVALSTMRAAAPPVPAQAAPMPVAPTCSCPSGDGSLRWPCDVHPPAVQASTSDERQEGGAA